MLSENIQSVLDKTIQIAQEYLDPIDLRVLLWIITLKKDGDFNFSVGEAYEIIDLELSNKFDTSNYFSKIRFYENTIKQFNLKKNHFDKEIKELKVPDQYYSRNKIILEKLPEYALNKIILELNLIDNNRFDDDINVHLIKNFSAIYQYLDKKIESIIKVFVERYGKEIYQILIGILNQKGWSINSGSYLFLIDYFLKTHNLVKREYTVKRGLFSLAIKDILKYKTPDLIVGENLANEKKFLEELVKPLSNSWQIQGNSNEEKLLRNLTIDIIEKDLFEKVFENILDLHLNNQGRNSGEYALPSEISNFINKVTDTFEVKKIYNPFAGLASFALALKPDQEYIAQDINAEVRGIGLIRLMLKGLTNVDYKLESSIVKWNVMDGPYDLVVSNPPFGMRFRNAEVDSHYQAYSYETYFLKRALDQLKTNGRVVGLVSSSILTSTSNHNLEFRKFLVDNNYVDTVISFPSGTLKHTAIKVSLLILGKDKKSKNVQFIDASSFIEIDKRELKFNSEELFELWQEKNDQDFSININTQKIASQDYILDAAPYFLPEIIGTTLSDILLSVDTERATNNIDKLVRFISIKDLKNDRLNYFLNLEDIELRNPPKSSHRISENCLLLSRVGGNLKPTFYQYAGDDIYINNILPLKINNNYEIDLDFLINELHSDYVLEQFEAFSGGAAQSIISYRTLEKIIIKLPSFENQQEIVKIKKEELLKEKKKEVALFSKIHGLESELIQQNTYLRHKIASPVSDIPDALENIRQILIDQILPSYPRLFELKLTENHPFSLGEYLNESHQDALRVFEAVKRSLNVKTDVVNATLSETDIISIIQRFVNKKDSKKNKSYSIKLEIDEEVFQDDEGAFVNPLILGNEELLLEMLENLFDNALKHAFKEEGNVLELFVTAFKSTGSESYFQLLFSNSGKPMPRDFGKEQFIQKGLRFGDKEGSGFGGWYINAIIDKHGGDFEILDETGEETLGIGKLATSFEINFPII